MTKTAVTKVKDLIALLSQCDPEGEVTLSLDEAIAYGDEDIGIAFYSFTPVFTCLFSAEDKSIADSVSIELSEEDTRPWSSIEQSILRSCTRSQVPA